MKWEYLVVYVEGMTVTYQNHEHGVQDFLDAVGQQGWELVTSVPLRIQNSTDAQEFAGLSQFALYFKKSMSSRKVKGTRDLSPVTSIPTNLDDVDSSSPS